MCTSLRAIVEGLTRSSGRADKSEWIHQVHMHAYHRYTCTYSCAHVRTHAYTHSEWMHTRCTAATCRRGCFACTVLDLRGSQEANAEAMDAIDAADACEEADERDLLDYSVEAQCRGHCACDRLPAVRTLYS